VKTRRRSLCYWAVRVETGHRQPFRTVRQLGLCGSQHRCIGFSVRPLMRRRGGHMRDVQFVGRGRRHPPRRPAALQRSDAAGSGSVVDNGGDMPLAGSCHA
jgi:hypothetical protein